MLRVHLYAEGVGLERRPYAPLLEELSPAAKEEGLVALGFAINLSNGLLAILLLLLVILFFVFFFLSF